MKKSILGILAVITMIFCASASDSVAEDIDLSAVCSNYTVSFDITGADVDFATATPDGDNGVLDIILSGVSEVITVTPTFTDNKADISGTNPHPVTVDLSDGFAITEFEVVFQDSSIPAGLWTINAVDADYEAESGSLTITVNPDESGVTYSRGEDAQPLTVEAEYTGSAEGVITYQWYSNTQKTTEGAIAIADATCAGYTPPTDTPGTTYYYAVATCNGLTAVSRLTEVTVEAPKLSVAQNIVDITDSTIHPDADEYVRLTNLIIIGSEIEKATENDKAVSIVLNGNTPDDAEVSFEFVAELSSAEISGHTGTVKLNGGKATQVVTVTAKSVNEDSWEASVSFTLNFSLGAPSERRAERIEITKHPEKTNYIEGESFDPSGMEVTIFFSDGSHETTQSFEYSPSGRLTADDSTITVTFPEATNGIVPLSAAVAITVCEEQSGGGGGGFYEDDYIPQFDSIDVYITFVNRGKIVAQNEKITVYDEDSDEKYCIGDAFLTFHRMYYPGGESGYREISGNGLNGWVAEFWGGSDPTFTYAHNYRWTKSTNDAIDEGDIIAVINGTDEMFYSDLYTWFEKSSYPAKAGEDTTFRVNGLNLMASNASYDALKAPAGATVTVYSQNGNEIKNMSTTVAKDGTFTLRFTESGTYTVKISGEAQWGSYDDAPVAPSTCTVKVADNTGYGGGGNDFDGNENPEETDAPLKGEAPADSSENPSGGMTMKNIKQAVSLTIAAIMTASLSSATVFASDWPQFLGNPKTPGVSYADSATKGDDIKLRWEKNTGSTWFDVPGTPVVAGEYVYYYSSQYLRKLELATGKEVAKVQIYGEPVNQFFVNIAYGDGKIFVPCQTDNLDDGLDIKGVFLRVFDAQTLTQLYVTESLGSGQPQTPVMYHNGYFVTGIYGRNAIYAGFSANDEDPARTDEIKPVSWSVDAAGKYGFSFNGAAFVGDMCYFGNGNLISIVNCKTGEARAFDIGEEYCVRSTLTYSSETNRLYVASNHLDSRAAVFSYKLDADGMPEAESVCKWISDVEGGGTQAAPVIHNGRLYLGGGGHTMGSNEPFHVLDAVTLKEIYSVPVLSKGSASISTAYANEKNNHQVYIYMVPYASGADDSSELWIISDSQGQTEAKYEIVKNIGRKQYCSQSLAVAPDGSLIWYNDGGYLYCYENFAGIFDDTKNHWARENIAYMARRKIVNGIGNNRFDPEGTITRAQFAQILANMSGEDFSDLKTDAFSDVGSEWFAPAVAWAVKNKIADTDTKAYRPDEPISREDMALMLCRYAEKNANSKLPEVSGPVQFADAEDISDKAKEAVALMQRSGIINGIAGGNEIFFAPKNEATRAQASAMIARFCKLIGR